MHRAIVVLQRQSSSFENNLYQGGAKEVRIKLVLQSQSPQRKGKTSPFEKSSFFVLVWFFKFITSINNTTYCYQRTHSLSSIQWQFPLATPFQDQSTRSRQLPGFYECGTITGVPFARGSGNLRKNLEPHHKFIIPNTRKIQNTGI